MPSTTSEETPLSQPRKRSKRCCLRCRTAKSRCELPDTSIRSSDQPLPTTKACHRCKVLSKPCVVADDGWKPTIHRRPNQKKSTTKPRLSTKPEGASSGANSNATVLTESQLALAPAASKKHVLLMWPLFSYELNLTLGLNSSMINDSDDIDKSYRTGAFLISPIEQIFKQLELHPEYRWSIESRQLNTGLSQCVYDLISLDLHQVLHNRFRQAHNLLWIPFIDNADTIRETFNTNKDVSSSLLLSLVYYIASNDLNYPNISSIRDQLVAIIRRDLLQVMVQAPHSIYAVHSLYILASIYPLHDDPNPVHVVENGTITSALNIAKSIGLDHAPKKIQQLYQSNIPIDTELIFKAATWYSLHLSKIEFSFSNSNCLDVPSASPSIDPSQILNLNFLDKIYIGILGRIESDHDLYNRSIRIAGLIAIGHRLHLTEFLKEKLCPSVFSSEFHDQHERDSIPDLIKIHESCVQETRQANGKFEHALITLQNSPMCKVSKDIFDCLFDWTFIHTEGIFTAIETSLLRSKLFKYFSTVPSVKTFINSMQSNTEMFTLARDLGVFRVDTACNIMSVFCNLLKTHKRINKNKSTNSNSKSNHSSSSSTTKASVHHNLPLPFPVLSLCAIIFSNSLFIVEVIAAAMIGFNVLPVRMAHHLFLLESTIESLEDIEPHAQSSIASGSIPLTIGQCLQFMTDKAKYWRTLMIGKLYSLEPAISNNDNSDSINSNHHNNQIMSLIRHPRQHQVQSFYNQFQPQQQHETRDNQSTEALVDLLMRDMANENSSQNDTNMGNIDFNNIQHWFDNT